VAGPSSSPFPFHPTLLPTSHHHHHRPSPPQRERGARAAGTIEDQPLVTQQQLDLPSGLVPAGKHVPGMDLRCVRVWSCVW
jgi:hypothetical protein